jgi:predicted nuclease of predicted toxin-antitoxin system
MKLIVDMNLPPRWVGFLATNGIEAVHWSEVGDPRAADSTIMKWALDGGYIVFTHDLDFSALLATAGVDGPSVLQIRTQNVMPESIGADVVRVLAAHAEAFEAGAIVTLDEAGSRVRVLPVQRPLVHNRH